MVFSRASRPNKQRAWISSIHFTFTWHTSKLSSLILWNARVTVSQSGFCLDWIPPCTRRPIYGKNTSKSEHISTATKILSTVRGGEWSFAHNHQGIYIGNCLDIPCEPCVCWTFVEPPTNINALEMVCEEPSNRSVQWLSDQCWQTLLL